MRCRGEYGGKLFSFWQTDSPYNRRHTAPYAEPHL